MGEQEPDRRSDRILLQEQLLFLHDQIIGIRILRDFLLSGALAVDHSALLINGEIAGMGIMNRNGTKVFSIVFLSRIQFQMPQDFCILLLKYLGISSVDRLSQSIVLSVMLHFINEKKGQDLDSPGKELPLLFQVGQDRLPDLDTAQLLFTGFSCCLSCIQPDSVKEFNGIIPSVHGFYDKAVPVLFQPAGMLIQVIANSHRSGDLLYALGTSAVKLEHCPGIRSGQPDPLQIQVSF